MPVLPQVELLRLLLGIRSTVRLAVVNLRGLEIQKLRQRLHVFARIALVAKSAEGVRALKLRGVHLAEITRKEGVPVVIFAVTLFVESLITVVAERVLAVRTIHRAEVSAIDAVYLCMTRSDPKTYKTQKECMTDPIRSENCIKAKNYCNGRRPQRGQLLVKERS